MCDVPVGFNHVPPSRLGRQSDLDRGVRRNGLRRAVMYLLQEKRALGGPRHRQQRQNGCHSRQDRSHRHLLVLACRAKALREVAIDLDVDDHAVILMRQDSAMIVSQAGDIWAEVHLQLDRALGRQCVNPEERSGTFPAPCPGLSSTHRPGRTSSADRKKRTRFRVSAGHQRVRLLCPPRQAPPRWQASLVGSYLLPNCINRENLMREDDSGYVLALPVADCPGI